jgi:hypothetical protein
MTNSPVLPTIGVGAMLNFVIDGWYVCPQQIDDATVLVVSQTPQDPTFTVSMYELGGDFTAKISLTQSGLYWLAVPEAGGLQYPLIMSPEEGQFVLNDDGRGNIEIENTVAPPAPEIHVAPGPPFPHLVYGTAQPISRFQILVVGADA